MATGPNIPRDYKYLAASGSGGRSAQRQTRKTAVSDTIRTALGRISWSHPLAYSLALLLVLMSTSTILIANAPLNDRLDQLTEVIELPLPSLTHSEQTTLAEIQLSADEDWTAVTVNSGETLGQIFRQQGLSATDVHRVIHSSDDAAKLTRIYPGDTLWFKFDDEGALAGLRYQLDELSTLLVSAGDDGYVTERIDRELVRQIHQASGVITDSLFMSGQRAGMSDALIMELAQLFGWDIDFVLDIRGGDSFHVIYEELYHDGELIRTGEILAASFINQGQEFRAFRFDTADGSEYFAPDGRNMKKSFLRAPLKFSAVTSNFNPRRMHPVLKTVRAHNGVDYAAPIGTPVVSTGKGKVIRSAYDKLNGHHVFVQHSNNIVTKYLHFSKRAVKKGQRVKQGQVVGYLGSTGRVTGAHLHYEFLLNGVHRNPRTVELPKAEPLPPALMADFVAASSPFQDRLNLMQQQELLLADSR